MNASQIQNTSDDESNPAPESATPVFRLRDCFPEASATPLQSVSGPEQASDPLHAETPTSAPRVDTLVDETPLETQDWEPETPPVEPTPALEQELWNTSGKLTVRLASEKDRNFKYGTVCVSVAVRAGLVPVDHNLAHGDQVESSVEGFPITWRVNRKTCATMAAHFPDALRLPQCVEGRLVPEIYDAVFLGPKRRPQAPETTSSAPAQGTPLKQGTSRTTQKLVLASLKACDFSRVVNTALRAPTNEVAV